mgnify:CR=1 FL=1
MKKHLVNVGYFVAMIISALFMLRSCVNLALAQAVDNPGYSLKGLIEPDIRADSLWTIDSSEEVHLLVPLQDFGWITDSIKWIVTDTTFEGDCKCRHNWVFDAEKPGSIDIYFIFGFEVIDCIRFNPDGKHCNEHQSATREKICRKCLRSEIDREQWFQRFVASPKSEFELLKDKQIGKQ